MSATDAMLARFQAELEEKRIQMDGMIEAAEAAGRDLTTEEMGLYERCRDRMSTHRRADEAAPGGRPHRR